MTDHVRDATKMVAQDGTMTDEQFAEIRGRHKIKSFRDQDWVDMDTMLTEVDRLREIEAEYIALVDIP